MGFLTPSSNPDSVEELVNSKLTTIQGWAAQAADAAKTTIDAIESLEIPTTVVNYPTAPDIPIPEAPVVWKEPIPTLEQTTASSSISESTNDTDSDGTRDRLGTVTNDYKAVDYSTKDTVRFRDLSDVATGFGEDGVTTNLGETYRTPVYAPSRPTRDLPLPPVNYPQQQPGGEPDAPELSDAPDFSDELAALQALTPPDLSGEINAAIDSMDDVVTSVNEVLTSTDTALFAVPVPTSEQEDALGSGEDLQALYSEMTQVVDELVSSAEGDFTEKLQAAFQKYVLDVVVDNDTQEGVIAELIQHQKDIMKAAVNEATWDAKLAKDKIRGDWGARNFPGPVGFAARDLAVEEVNIRKDMRKTNDEAARKVREYSEQLARTKYNNSLAIINAAFAFERVSMQAYVRIARQELAYESLRVQAQIQLYEAAVNNFRTRQEAYAAYVNTYDATADFVVDANRAQSVAQDASALVPQANEVKNIIYSAQLKGSQGQAELGAAAASAASLPFEAYQAQVSDGVTENLKTAEENIRNYQSAVRGYAEALRTANRDLESYAAQLSTNASAVNVEEANTRAYAAYVKETSRSDQIRTAYLKAQGGAMKETVKAWREAAETNQNAVEVQASRMVAKQKVEGNRGRVYTQQVRDTDYSAYDTYNRAQAARTNALLVHSATAAENAARAESLISRARAESERVNIGAKAAKAEALAGLAQGAMSALNVGSSVQGNSRSSESYTYNDRTTATYGGTTDRTERVEG